MHIHVATIATYFAVGIEAGACDEDQARQWAFAVIGALDAPPGEIIEVSWRKPRADLVADLKAVPGIAARQQAGQWLLASLYAKTTVTDRLYPIMRAAKHIVTAMQLGDDLYYEIDRLEENIEMAELGLYGTASEAHADFHASFSIFPLPPFTQGWSNIIFDVDKA